MFPTHATHVPNRSNAPWTVVGAVFLGIMLNGLTIKDLPYSAQDFIKGSCSCSPCC